MVTSREILIVDDEVGGEQTMSIQHFDNKLVRLKAGLSN